MGTLHVARPGSATVETAEGTFLVARGGLREGMDGDEATVTLVRRGPGEPQAVVQGVLRRACERFVGTFEWAGPLGAVVALDERIRRDFFVLPDDKAPERLHVSEGDIVEARILTYPARREAGVVTLERRIGRPEGLDLPIERVIASNGLATHFGQAALEQAEQIHDDVAETIAAEPKRHDLRELLCVTIDPATARDFDDAVSCERREGGGWRLGVHIADVSHYVRPGSPIDLDARVRTCSAYLVDRVLPMLPERLCDDLCSLVAGRDRLAMSVFADIDEGGEVVGHAAWCSTIRSKARLSYDQVDAVLEGAFPAAELPHEPEASAQDLEELLRMLDEVARLRRRVRRERGAVDFETVEAKVELDGEGVPTGVSVRERTRATSLVEEAMLVANEVVAQMLAPHAEEVPCAFRVHERPAPDSMGQALPALRELDLLEPGEYERLRAADPFALQDVLERASGTSAEVPANSLLLRAQKRAVYLPRNDGHYALGASAYCHFTSPIRRYPDVTVHRALKVRIGMAADAGFDVRARRAELAAIPQLCHTCSERERAADAAARESQRVKMAQLMEQHVGESFSGVVVGVERFGLFVRLDETCAEGLLPIRALGDEWFAYDEGTMCLTGESTGHRWHLGRRVAVTVAGCKPEKGQIDFTLARGACLQAAARKDVQ
ncbi:ribonuclease R family protein [uncultured Parolsenella sp.]|uniref:ribonuclease R family protein n=1 Tax=uncultured Parolsenella sp. TaxID=2083008 RepID=UPI002659350E|nr:VacB/RNase II family 3'-5' exoribonuclease [uncultured Parolsenella sp.]